jgi:hypothetical protein
MKRNQLIALLYKKIKYLCADFVNKDNVSLN